MPEPDLFAPPPDDAERANNERPDFSDVTVEEPAAPPGPSDERSRWRRFLWPTWAERRRTLRRQAWFVVLASIPLIVGAYAASGMTADLENTEPAYVAVAWAAFLVLTLAPHLGVLLAVIALVAVLARKGVLAVCAGGFAALLLAPTARFYVPDRAAPSAAPTLRVISANLLMINENTQPIIEEILASDADVVLVQEYAAHWEKALNAALSEQYPHSVGVAREDSFGTAVYSRRPFIEPVKTDVELGTIGSPQIRAVIEHAGRPVAIYNVHLLPPRTLAYTTHHRAELLDLATVLANEPHPFVMGGDFNFTDSTSGPTVLSIAGVYDAWDEAGYGWGATWPVHSFMRYLPIPGLRIDHVYHSAEWRATSARTGEGRGSDHRPLIVDLVRRERDR